MPEELPASELDAPSIDFLLRSQRLMGIKRTLAVQKVCASCDTEGGFQLKCGTCLVTYYCNADYQKTHWKKHKVSSRPPVPVVSSKYALALPDYAVSHKYLEACVVNGGFPVIIATLEYFDSNIIAHTPGDPPGLGGLVIYMDTNGLVIQMDTYGYIYMYINFFL